MSLSHSYFWDDRSMWRFYSNRQIQYSGNAQYTSRPVVHPKIGTKRHGCFYPGRRVKSIICKASFLLWVWSAEGWNKANNCKFCKKDKNCIFFLTVSSSWQLWSWGHLFWACFFFPAVWGFMVIHQRLLDSRGRKVGNWKEEIYFY